MATVITNLLSAIPVFGKDLVELNFVTKFIEASCFLHSCMQHMQLPVLATIGTVSLQAKNRSNRLRVCRSYEQQRRQKEDLALSLPYPFIAFLVGLIDGDGYIQISKTTKGYISIKLVICLSLKDLSSLEYIYSVINLGKISIDRDRIHPTCKLIINKTDLQEIIFPLLNHHNMFFLTDRRKSQFELAMFILKNDIKYYNDISQYTTEYLLPTNSKISYTPEDYLNLTFFKNWLVGFTNAEGSFCKKKNNDACFQLKQIIHVQLFEAFKLLFKTNRNISIEMGKYAQFSVSSKTDIQTVIDFFSFSGLHPLIGLKYIQYLKWITSLQNSYRYKNLNFPS